jgi:hypothetical protein
VSKSSNKIEMQRKVAKKMTKELSETTQNDKKAQQ